MRYVISAAAILYALLSLYASLSLWKRPARRTPAAIMTAGGVILLAAGILELRGWTPAWLVVVIGSLLICQAALIHGRLSGRNRLENYTLRFLISAFLILGAAFW